jgi:hypothetical protein
MKKFINPEMNVSLFDVENIVTESTTAQDAAKQAIAENGVQIGGETVSGVKSVTITF